MDPKLLETALVAFTTFFAVIGPVDVATIFTAITPGTSAQQRRRMAVKGTLIASIILLFFALFGEAVLRLFGISLPALRTAGGVLLLLIAIDLVFARSSGSTSTTDEEEEEGRQKQDVSVFPLATPLIAGPGTIGAVILLVANAEGDSASIAMVVTAMSGVLALTLVLLLAASYVQKILGVTGVHVVSRVVGVLLAALAVQFIFDGISNSGLLG